MEAGIHCGDGLNGVSTGNELPGGYCQNRLALGHALFCLYDSTCDRKICFSFSSVQCAMALFSNPRAASKSPHSA